VHTFLTENVVLLWHIPGALHGSTLPVNVYVPFHSSGISNSEITVPDQPAAWLADHVVGQTFVPLEL
jgi:hypothetical protein